ncbi:MAG: RNA-binding protein [Candidatus Diapherotrites archaeon]|nr:RNA-binding protein [Candidatus Diapherotrites archaeon]
MRRIVIPGEVLMDDTGVRAGFGAYKEDGKIYSSLYGVAEEFDDAVRVVPLCGKYKPYKDDFVVGIVEAVRFKGCFVDLNSPYKGYLAFERDDEFKVGDIIFVKIDDVDEANKIGLVDGRLLYDGKLITIAPVKIPRVVGKKGSMLNILRTDSRCMIFVGRNGRIFIKGRPEEVERAENAIRMIEREAHTSGLTERVKSFLSGSGGPVRPEAPKEEQHGEPDTVFEQFGEEGD